MSLIDKLQREIIGAMSYRILQDVRQISTKREVEETEFLATTLEFGNEIAFAVLSLETEPAGTKATFEVELRGRKRRVTVE